MTPRTYVYTRRFCAFPFCTRARLRPVTWGSVLQGDNTTLCPRKVVKIPGETRLSASLGPSSVLPSCSSAILLTPRPLLPTSDRRILKPNRTRACTYTLSLFHLVCLPRPPRRSIVSFISQVYAEPSERRGRRGNRRGRGAAVCKVRAYLSGVKSKCLAIDTASESVPIVFDVSVPDANEEARGKSISRLEFYSPFYSIRTHAVADFTGRGRRDSNRSPYRERARVFLRRARREGGGKRRAMGSFINARARSVTRATSGAR